MNLDTCELIHGVLILIMTIILAMLDHIRKKL